jgi:DNA-3-methyladenine glycosylase II
LAGQPQALDLRALDEGVRYLSALDPDLARLSTQLGTPPLWNREPGFPTLVLIILEQQVSLASARAAFARLGERLGVVTPESFLTLDDLELRGIGFSRQKAGYCRGLARSALSGGVDLASLLTLDDSAARSTLVGIRGIGPWTADIYLLMALLRPDIWPSGDLALLTAVQEVKRLPRRPAPDEMESIAAPWRPWRAVAARLLWSYYLSSRP